MYEEIKYIAERIEHGSLSGDKDILDEIEKVLYEDDDIGGMEITPAIELAVSLFFVGIILLIGAVIGLFIGVIIYA